MVEAGVGLRACGEGDLSVGVADAGHEVRLSVRALRHAAERQEGERAEESQRTRNQPVERLRPAKGTDPDDWEGRCVSRYAASATQEDFAETFMFFLKYKGKIPARFANKPAIRKKWKAVAEIVRRVTASPR